MWIEIAKTFIDKLSYSWSLSARRVWIEMYHLSIHLTTTTSLSARRVWIEILHRHLGYDIILVTLREEGVD